MEFCNKSFMSLLDMPRDSKGVQEDNVLAHAGNG